MLESVREAINEVLVESGRAPLESLSAETNLRVDVGLDSLDLAELTVRIEFRHGVDVFSDGVIVETVGEIIQRIESKS